MLYSDINYRGTVCDLDVLVEENCHNSAEDLLRENGYDVEGRTEPAEFQWQKETVIKGDVFGVDLHWNLSRHWQDKKVLEEMFRDARQEYLEGIPYLSLSLEDELIYLSVHLATGNGYRSLLLVADIARFIRISHDKINAEKLLDKARRFHLSNSLYYGLWLAGRFFDCEIRKGLMLKISPSFLKRLLVYPFVRRKNFFAQTFTNRLVENYLSFFLFDLVEAKGLKDYTRLFRLMLFPRSRESKLSFGRFAKIIFAPFHWLDRGTFKGCRDVRAEKISG